jgi:hypothetical protein
MTDLKVITNEDSPNQEALEILKTISNKIRKGDKKISCTILLKDEDSQISIYSINASSPLEILGYLNVAEHIILQNNFYSNTGD